jgi:hypothetical protein
MLALMTVFLESLGSLHIVAILGSIFSLAVQEKNGSKLQIATGDMSCFILEFEFLSSQDELFVISCSVAVLFQANRIHMPHVALAGVVF